MFDNYLDFFYMCVSSILDDKSNTDTTSPITIGIKIDENGVEVLGEMNEDTPKEIVKIYELINTKIESLTECGELEKLTPEDIDSIVSQVFIDGLGEPDMLDESEHDGTIYQRRSWNLKNGTLTRTIVKPKSDEEIKAMDVNSIEYLEATLQEALKNENYSLAAELRDKINNF